MRYKLALMHMNEVYDIVELLVVVNWFLEPSRMLKERLRGIKLDLLQKGIYQKRRHRQYINFLTCFN